MRQKGRLFLAVIRPHSGSKNMLTSVGGMATPLNRGDVMRFRRGKIVLWIVLPSVFEETVLVEKTASISNTIESNLRRATGNGFLS